MEREGEKDTERDNVLSTTEVSLGRGWGEREREEGERYIYI